MGTNRLRVGLIGAGQNTRVRHIPGLRSQADVEILAVSNRRPASTAAVAREFAIPRTYERWQNLIQDSEIDAVVIGTWPYLHCPVTLAVLEAGKHVLTEARMSLNAREAHQMLAAAKRHRGQVCQLVPSPYGLKGHAVVLDLIRSGFLGELRGVNVWSFSDALADPGSPLSWRQDAALSGYNMLNLGILHETLLRWVPPPVRVFAQVHAFIPSRIDPESGVHRAVGTPDSIQALTILENGARAVYHLSGVTAYGQGSSIQLLGSKGTLQYDLVNDRLWGASSQMLDDRKEPKAVDPRVLSEIPIPEDKVRGWRVEEDFVESIRTGAQVGLTDFQTGVRYMEFTEAVARSAQEGIPVDLPLDEFLEDEEEA
jgi:predicted dehydrogenase